MGRRGEVGGRRGGGGVGRKGKEKEEGGHCHEILNLGP